MDPPRRFPKFTPAEWAAYATFHQLGDAARRGLHLSERVTAQQIVRAHLHAMDLERRIPPRAKEKLK